MVARVVDGERLGWRADGWWAKRRGRGKKTHPPTEVGSAVTGCGNEKLINRVDEGRDWGE
jgi:hypothetical protein